MNPKSPLTLRLTLTGRYQRRQGVVVVKVQAPIVRFPHLRRTVIHVYRAESRSPILSWPARCVKSPISQ